MCVLMCFIYDVLVKRKAVVKVDSFHVFAKLYDITKWQQTRTLWCCRNLFITMLIFFTTAIWFKNKRIQLLTASLLRSGEKMVCLQKRAFSIRHRCKRRIHREGIIYVISRTELSILTLFLKSNLFYDWDRYTWRVSDQAYSNPERSSRFNLRLPTLYL